MRIQVLFASARGQTWQQDEDQHREQESQFVNILCGLTCIHVLRLVSVFICVSLSQAYEYPLRPLDPLEMELQV